MPVSLLSSSEFISKIIQDADMGHCFVPLVGSGLSSPSGIIMGMEFTNYLAFTTYLVLSDPHERAKTHGEGNKSRWDICKRGWPPLPTSSEVSATTDWVFRQFDKICERYDLLPNHPKNSHEIRSLSPGRTSGPARVSGVSHEILTSLLHPRIPSILAAPGSSHSSEAAARLASLLLRRTVSGQPTTAGAAHMLLAESTGSFHNGVIEAGIRSLHDWRETLMFLSSVSVKSNRLEFVAPNYSIIDRFNSFITRDKHPNLGHKMLAHLSGPLRIHAVLTTNFDSLIEDAFRALQMNIRVLPVSSKGHLPEPQSISADFAVVKLHGEAQDTRADLSLDEEPSDEDKSIFSAYLTRGAGHLRSGESEHPDKKRLLVIGYSGNDHRCVQMIKHWLECRSDRELAEQTNKPLVYWVCFSKWDVERIRRIFGATEYAKLVRATQTERPDLLLYELYQRLMLSLPPGGLTYEFSHVVPPRLAKSPTFSQTQIENAITCADAMEDTLEASRVLLSEKASSEATRQLNRDVAVQEVYQLILDLLEGRIELGTTGDKKPYFIGKQSTAVLWQPRYRNRNANENSDIYPTGPILIDCLGGVTRGAAKAVEEIGTKSRKVFWIDAQDYMDADALLRDLLRSLALRCGAYQGRQVTQHPLDHPLGGSPTGNSRPSETEEPAPKNPNWERDAKAVAKHLQDVLVNYRIDASQIVVMIYGRDSYGVCSGLVPSPWVNTDSKPNKASFNGLHCILEALAIAQIPVIYFPLVETRAEQKRSRFAPKKEAGRASYQNDSDAWNSWPYDEVATAIFESETDSDKKTGLCLSHTESGKTSIFPDLVGKILSQFGKAARTPDHLLSFEQESERFSLLSEKRRHLTFLYAATLFRHSRHLNALCSEAVFHCPFRFNQVAVDNDYLRSEQLTRWIDELRESQIFYEKPGGASWMHRDTRMAIQVALESLSLSQPNSNSDTAVNRHLWEMRSRQHVWIGDWYHKAFMSSGHLTPIIESVHHRIMAALFAPRAFYKRTESDLRSDEKVALAEYRFVLYESSLIEAQKCLYSAWRALRLWQPSPIEVSWVGKAHRDEIAKQLAVASKRIVDDIEEEDQTNLTRKWKERAERAATGLLDTLKALSQDLLLEGGGAEYRDKESSEQQEGGKGNNPTATKTSSPEVSPVNAALTAAVLGRAQTEHNAKGEKVVEPLEIDHGWFQVNSSIEELENHVVKSFKSPRVNLGEILNEIQSLTGVLRKAPGGVVANVDRLTDLSKQKGKWKGRYDDDPKVLHDTVWLLGEFAYLMLRRAKLVFHAEQKVEPSFWLASTIACNLGIDFCRHLPTWLSEYDLYTRVKLQTVYGVSLANLGRFFESARHLNEAQAILSKVPGASRADLAILMLRRSEALLTECEWTAMIAEGTLVHREVSDQDHYFVRIDNKNSLLGETDMRLIDGQPESPGWSIGELAENIHKEAEAKRWYVPPRIAECFRKTAKGNEVVKVTLETGRHAEKKETVIGFPLTKSTLASLCVNLLDEAVALLDQAEHGLSGTSQSSLWWSRLHTLRLRVYGLLAKVDDPCDCLIFRNRSAEQGIFESFHHALRIARRDPFRRYRALKYFFHAEQWHRRFANEGDVAKSHLPDSYRDAVAAFMEYKVKQDGLDLDVIKGKRTRKTNKGTGTHLLERAIRQLAKDWGECDTEFRIKWNN
ncbi:MAG: SIR2 family protein [Planctomycetaceae bacterium]|nr:SIR2 family protein [Planctomycetaceae bacterium]